MNLLKMTTGPECVIYSAAMVFEVEPWKVKEWLRNDAAAHDGYYMLDLQEALLEMGWALVPLEVFPVDSAGVPLYNEQDAEKRMWELLSSYQGFVQGEQKHLAAWNRAEQKVYDPNGVKMSIQKWSDKYGLTYIWVLGEFKISPLLE